MAKLEVVGFPRNTQLRGARGKATVLPTNARSSRSRRKGVLLYPTDHIERALAGAVPLRGRLSSAENEREVGKGSVSAEAGAA